MKHDALCELSTTSATPSCKCGSRAYPLCDGCRDGQHVKHRDLTFGGDLCQCDLGCKEVAW